MIQKLRLLNFRNFEEKLLEFTPHINVIVGHNAAGKTNILESIVLLSTGKSFRAKLDQEMIKVGENMGRTKARIESNGENYDLEVILTPRKKFFVNNVAKRQIDSIGILKQVLFGPWDLDLVNDAPSIRRRFLDLLLSQVDREYRRSLHSYEKGLRQRNKLLVRIREENISRSQLLFWDTLLIKNGDYISHKRTEFIEFANSIDSSFDLHYQLVYDKSAISEARLEKYAQAEVAAATTLVGPHRDDFIFNVIDSEEVTRNLASFGSRGEQRMAVLWLKLAELTYIKQTTQEMPTLLLDDIFSELDEAHRELVMNIAQKQQTIITTADPHHLSGNEVTTINLEAKNS